MCVGCACIHLSPLVRKKRPKTRPTKNRIVRPSYEGRKDVRFSWNPSRPSPRCVVKPNHSPFVTADNCEALADEKKAASAAAKSRSNRLITARCTLIVTDAENKTTTHPTSRSLTAQKKKHLRRQASDGKPKRSINRLLSSP